MRSTPTQPTSRAWMEVDAGALRRNFHRLARRVGPDRGVLPMVKADGYGLGAARVVELLAGCGPWGFGVATAREGAELRRGGWEGRVVVFSPCLALDLPLAASRDLEPVLAGPAALEALEEPPAEEDGALPVHVEVDTGMGRLGFPWDDPEAWVPRLRELAGRSRIRVAGTLTHFHSAGSDARATEEQWRRFRRTVGEMESRGLEPGLLHAANSAAALRHPATRGDLVRPGLFLYGGGAGELRPEAVVRVRARVLEVRRVKAGSTVSYGATYTTPAPARLATLGIGYGDGLRRELSNRGHVLLHGRRAPIRGRVCMDTTVVELPADLPAEAGDAATVLGVDGSREVGLDEMAETCGTIGYEILTGWSPRLPRLVRREGRGGDEGRDEEAG